MFFSLLRSALPATKLAVPSGEGGGDTEGNSDCKAGGDTAHAAAADSKGMAKGMDPGQGKRPMAMKNDLGNGEGECTAVTEDKEENEEEEETVVSLDGIQLLFDIEAAELIPLIIRWVLVAEGVDHSKSRQCRARN